MTGKFNVVREVIELGKRQAVVETKIDNIETIVGETKSDVKCLDKKIMNALKNNATQNTTLAFWDWFWKAILITTLGGLIGVSIKIVFY
jgi:hypothetical protein